MKWKLRIAALLLPAALSLTGCSQSSESSVPADKFTELMQLPNAVILDVRTAAEFGQGHIPGAVLLDVQQPVSFKQGAAKIDAGATCLVYCRSGHRSKKAVEMLKELGLRHVYELDGGFSRWTGQRTQ